MMTHMLGGNDSSLLFERIREDLGLSCYGIYTCIMRHSPFNLLEISCGIFPNELDTLHKEVLVQIEHICNDKLKPDMLKRSKASIKTSLVKSFEQSTGINQILIENYPSR